MVGLVLVLALLVTYASHEARSAIPRQGLDAERAWSDELESTARETAAALGGADSANLRVPPPPAPPGFHLANGGRLAGPPPSGAVSLLTSCASFRAQHTVSGIVILDTVNASRGCLELRLDPVYGRAVTYVVELGGVVRVQPDGAVVVAGPPLALDQPRPGVYRVALVLPSLEAPAQQRALASQTVELEIVPLRSTEEGSAGPAADSTEWTLATRHPLAWRDWFAGRVADAGWNSSVASVACDPVDCTKGADGLGRIVVRIEGPSTTVRDVDVSITQTLVRASLR